MNDCWQPNSAASDHGAIGVIDLIADTITCGLCDDTGGWNKSHDDLWYDAGGANDMKDGLVGGSNDYFDLSSKAIVDGGTTGQAYDADNRDGSEAAQLTSVGAGTNALNCLGFIKNRGLTANADPLLWEVDTGTGFDFVPVSSTVEIVWDNGADRIWGWDRT